MTIERFFNFLRTKSKFLNFFNLIVFIIPIIIYSWVIYLRFNNVGILDDVATEDNLFENLQVLFYFLSFLVCVVGTILAFKRKIKPEAWIFLILAVGLFFWTGEEISWGQRIFNTETSEFFKQNNYQGENTIHNISWLFFLLDNGFLVIGLVGVLAILFSSRIFKIKRLKKIKVLEKFIPPPKYFLYLFILFLIYFLYLQVRHWDIFWYTSNMDTRELETGELLLSIAVFGTLLESLYKIIKNRC